MSAPTVSSMEADEIMDRFMGHGRATSGGRGSKKVQLTPYQRKQLEITPTEKKNGTKFTKKINLFFNSMV